MLSDLTARQAKAADKAYTLADADGLSLYATGFKPRHFRFTYGGKRKRMSFGARPRHLIQGAPHPRNGARALLTRCINPQVERKRKHRATIRLASRARSGWCDGLPRKAMRDPLSGHQDAAPKQRSHARASQVGTVRPI